MALDKLKRFREMKSFSNVFEPERLDLEENVFPLQGHWHATYFKNENPIVVELGCGKGEYTIGLSQQYLDHNFIGIDIKGARMYVGAKTALLEERKNVGFVRTNIREVQKLFGKDEVSEIWITFPDPQPQESRRRKRLTHPEFLLKYQSFLKSDGILHLKTDSSSLYEWTLNMLQEIGATILFHSNNLYKDYPQDDPILGIKTYYETLFSEQGYSINYIKFQLPEVIVYQD
jgi:tRNA (guanine-N7-)-methyltransferase